MSSGLRCEHVWFCEQVWDSTTLQCMKTLEGHEDNVRVLAVGDRHVFSGSWDKTIRVRTCFDTCVLAAQDHRSSYSYVLERPIANVLARSCTES